MIGQSGPSGMDKHNVRIKLVIMFDCHSKSQDKIILFVDMFDFITNCSYVKIDLQESLCNHCYRHHVIFDN